MRLLRIALAIALTFGGMAHAQTPAKQLFGAKTSASSQRAAAYGGYSKGCLAGGEQLPETGPTWQAMRLGRNRNWGHPETIDFIRELSAYAATQPWWEGLYIGDISQPRGGPMLSGHRSHQLGLDVDIWMRPPDRLTLSRQERENLSSIDVTRAKEAYVNGNWSGSHHRIIRRAAQDRRVARIFVSAGIKVQMCNAENGNRAYLRKIRPWWKHNYHFHVRLACPRGARGCVDQAPTPPGDGCAEAQKWVNDILNPPPPQPQPKTQAKPRVYRDFVLADLPQQCAAVLQSQ